MRLSLKAKVLSLAVLPVLLFALVISLTTLFILQEQAHKEVEQTRERLLGAEHPQTLGTLDNLAKALVELAVENATVNASEADLRKWTGRTHEPRRIRTR